MNGKEVELREIISQFRPRVKNEDVFVAKLLLLKDRYENNLKRQPRAPTPSQVKRKIATVVTNIDNAALTFCELFPDMPGLIYPMTYEGKPEKQIGSYVGDFTWEHFIKLLSEAKALVKDASEYISEKQPTRDNIQFDAITLVGEECFFAGVKISASENSQFFKIARWLLGIDPRNAIKKSKVFIASDVGI